MGKPGNSYVSLCRFPGTKVPSGFLGITLINYTHNNEFSFRRKILDWIKMIEQTVNIKSNTVVKKLSGCCDFKKVISSATQKIMMSSSLCQLPKHLGN